MAKCNGVLADRPAAESTGRKDYALRSSHRPQSQESRSKNRMGAPASPFPRLQTAAMPLRSSSAPSRNTNRSGSRGRKDSSCRQHVFPRRPLSCHRRHNKPEKRDLRTAQKQARHTLPRPRSRRNLGRKSTRNSRPQQLGHLTMAQ